MRTTEICWKLAFGVALATLLSGCATTTDQWIGPPGTEQALADCRLKSDSSPALTNATQNPMFAAAMQQQFINDCMAAKGYRLQ